MSCEPDIGILDPDCLQAVWPDVAELLEQRGQELLRTFTPRELFVAVLSSRYDLWMVNQGVDLKLIGFCAWEEHDLRKWYHVIWVGGSGLDLLKQAIPKVEQYACLRGASELVFGGRLGWGRLLRPLGFVPQGKWAKSVETCWKH